MVDYMSLEEQVDVDFGRARRRAFFGSLRARFLRGRDRLLSFDAKVTQFGARSSADLEVPDLELAATC